SAPAPAHPSWPCSRLRSHSRPQISHSLATGFRRRATSSATRKYLVPESPGFVMLSSSLEGLTPMQAEVKGTVMPTLEVQLAPGEYVVTPHGELAWMTAGIQMSQTTGNNGGGGGFMGGLKRMVGGGGITLTRYEGPGSVTFAAKVPGHIVPIDIRNGDAYMVHRHGFLCATPDITVGAGFQQGFRAGLFGGDGFVMQKLEGQGRAWIEVGGEMTSYELPPGQ